MKIVRTLVVHSGFLKVYTHTHNSAGMCFERRTTAQYGSSDRRDYTAHTSQWSLNNGRGSNNRI